MVHYTLVIIHGYGAGWEPLEIQTVIKTAEPLIALQERHKPYAYGFMNFETGEVRGDYDPQKDISRHGPMFIRFKEEDIIRELTSEEVAELFRRIRHQNEQLTAATKNFLEF